MTYKDEQKQREYNKLYYQNNKAQIEKKIGAKEECPHCKRMIRHQYMQKHLKSVYCQSRRTVNQTTALNFPLILLPNQTVSFPHMASDGNTGTMTYKMDDKGEIQFEFRV
jgi:hypothetical protein